MAYWMAKTSINKSEVGVKDDDGWANKDVYTMDVPPTNETGPTCTHVNKGELRSVCVFLFCVILSMQRALSYFTNTYVQIPKRFCHQPRMANVGGGSEEEEVVEWNCLPTRHCHCRRRCRGVCLPCHCGDSYLRVHVDMWR